MVRRITQILVFCINIVGILSDVNSITIEQTNGYNDSWVNMNRTCSLLGVGLTGNMLEHKVVIPNGYDITETGWISAHIKREGSLEFLGCTHGTDRTGASCVEVSYRRIPECVYFCGLRDILLHRNFCYCASDVSLDNQSTCLASQCGDEEHPIFCGQSSNCMCRYKQLIKTNKALDHLPPNIIKNCSIGKVSNRDVWNVGCEVYPTEFPWEWNGNVKRYVFYWGNNPSITSDNHSCVALVRRITIPILLALPCSTYLPGICIKGTRIPTTPPTTHPSTTNIHTTNGYDTTSDVTSHKISKQPTNNAITQYHSTNIERTSMNTFLESRNTNAKDQTNILGPVIGGAGAFVVILIVSVVVIVCVVRKRRRDKNCRSELPHELHGISSGKQQHQNQNFYSEVDNHANERINRTEENGEYDSFTSKKQNDNGHDMYDHTSGTQHNMYGRLNRNGKPNAPSDKADIYYHTRTVVNGDTYDTFKTGACRKDSSNDYYDHTFGGEAYGHLGEGAGCKEPADDIYDHSRAIIRSNGDMYDSFQTYREGQETDLDRDEYCSVNTGNGYLN